MHQFYFFLMPLQILMILGQFITLASKLNGSKDLIINLLHLSNFNQFCYLWTCIVKFVEVSYTFYHIPLQYIYNIFIKCGAINPRYTTKTCTQILSTNSNNFHLIKKTYIVNCLSNKCFFNLAHCLPFAKLCIRLKLKIKNV